MDPTQIPTLDDFKAVQDALNRLNTAMYEFVSLSDKIPNITNIGSYIHVFNDDHCLKMAEVIRTARLVIGVEIHYYEETKNMTAEEKAAFYLKRTFV